MLLSIGLEPYDLMLQLMAKSKDPFSGGKNYYSHPSLNNPETSKKYPINLLQQECRQYPQLALQWD